MTNDADDYHVLRLQFAERILLEKARGGELWAIQNLLHIAAEALAEGVRLTPGVAAYISAALQKIYEGSKADDAFGIKRRRGEKDHRRARQRAYWMADCVERLWNTEHLTLEKAVARVAEQFRAKEDTVKRAWKDNYREARRQIALEVQHLGKVMPITLP